MIAGGIESEIALASSICDDDAAIHGRILRDLSRRRLERPPQYLNPGAFIALAFRLFLLDGRDAAEQRQTATRHDAFGNCRLGGADRIVQRLFLRLHLRFRGRADADHGDAAGQLGEPFLQLFLVVVAGRLLDLPAYLLDPAVDLLAVAAAADDRRGVLVDDDPLGATELIERRIFQLETELLGDDLRPVSTAISCSIALRRSPKPGALTAQLFSTRASD